MSFEDNLSQQRFDKIREIEQLGFEAYPRKFAYSYTLAEIRAAYDHVSAEQLESSKPQVTVAGRLMTKRRQGKAGFAHLQKDGERFQIYVRQDEVGERDFELYKKLDAGDIIGVEGVVFRTKTNELTVKATKLEFLSKAILPLPEKYHGLQDVETRYRQRYVDLFVNEEVRDVFVKRNLVIQALRRALDRRHYIEVETPMMQPLYGGALARPFKTHHNALDIDLYLRIAPELYLKRLVVGGLDRVYEINRNFRNEGLSMRHNPEFTMLEFYQAYSDYRDLMELSAELLRETAEATLGGSTLATFREQQIDFAHLNRLTLREALCEYWPHGGLAPTLPDLDDPGKVRSFIERHNERSESKINLTHGHTLGSMLQALFEETCETRLIQPTLIYEYPVEASPLSKQKPDDPNWVERFEIYVAGMEVANAYSELNDPQEQRRRFESQVAMRAGGDAEAHGMDEDYLRALSYGMPPTAGEGIGIDRLVMVLTNSPTIRDVILFPLLRPEGDIGMADRLRRLEAGAKSGESG
ncbi:MAG: lysine--tRNA ligase [Acidobacteria bacterium]|nr:lysine--tRNA ligase [Acidobacteriota bacterium]